MKTKTKKELLKEFEKLKAPVKELKQRIQEEKK